MTVPFRESLVSNYMLNTLFLGLTHFRKFILNMLTERQGWMDQWVLPNERLEHEIVLGNHQREVYP